MALVHNDHGAGSDHARRGTDQSIHSLGAAYQGIECLTVALDVRYLDYRNTTLWGDAIPTPGLGWNGVFAVALGAQLQLTERSTVRIGYLANENPIPDVGTLFNMQLPTINQQQIAFGGSRQMTDAISMDMAIIYAFSSSIQGPVPIPGGNGNATVGLKQDYVSAALGLSFDY